MLSKYCKGEVNTIQEAIDSDSLPISSIKKEYGEVELQAVLVLLLTDVIDFFSVGKSMSDGQVAETIKLILKEFFYFKIDDFKLCFDRAKTGKYGKVYDRIDGNIIFEWLELYDFERLEEIERIRTDQHEKIIKEDLSAGWTEESKQMISKIVSSFEQVKKEISIEPRILKKQTDADRIIQSWLKKFDSICYKQLKWIRNEKGDPVGRFIKISGKMLDMNQYLKYKLEQQVKVKSYLLERVKNER